MAPGTAAALPLDSFWSRSPKSCQPSPFSCKEVPVAWQSGKPPSPGTAMGRRQCGFPPASPLLPLGSRPTGVLWEAEASVSKYLLPSWTEGRGFEQTHKAPVLMKSTPFTQMRPCSLGGPGAAQGAPIEVYMQMWMPHPAVPGSIPFLLPCSCPTPWTPPEPGPQPLFLF